MYNDNRILYRETLSRATQTFIYEIKNFSWEGGGRFCHWRRSRETLSRNQTKNNCSSRRVALIWGYDRVPTDERPSWEEGAAIAPRRYFHRARAKFPGGDASSPIIATTIDRDRESRFDEHCTLERDIERNRSCIVRLDTGNASSESFDYYASMRRYETARRGSATQYVMPQKSIGQLATRSILARAFSRERW